MAMNAYLYCRAARRVGGGWMLVTRFEIHVSWRIVWREPGALLKEGVGGGTAPSKASGQARIRSVQRAASTSKQSSEGVGDCCRVRLAPRSSDRGGARSPQVTLALATHRRSCSPESSTPDLSSSVEAPHLACLPPNMLPPPSIPPPSCAATPPTAANPPGLAGPFPSQVSCEDRKYLG